MGALAKLLTLGRAGASQRSGGYPRSPNWVSGCVPTRRGRDQPQHTHTPPPRKKKKKKEQTPKNPTQTTRILLEEEDFPVFKELRQDGVTWSGGDNAWHWRILGGFPEAPYIAEGGGRPRARLRDQAVGERVRGVSCRLLHAIVCHSR